MNLILWAEKSSAAVPFSTLVALLAMWFGVSVPLTFVGKCKMTCINIPIYAYFTVYCWMFEILKCFLVFFSRRIFRIPQTCN